MPMVELKVCGTELPEPFVRELETRITAVLRDTISTSFAVGLGWGPADPNHALAKQTVERVMPGWTMVNVEQCRWAWGGERNGEVVVRLQTFVMEGAVSQEWRRAISTNLYALMAEMFADAGDKLRIFNTCVEGEVTMYLPPAQFYGLLGEGETHKELDVPEIAEWMTARIKKNIEAGAVA
ncbi:hypothetical protein [Xylanimonas ulmi]|uniref:Tautomerase cis-CaaD-like domain-containing protein n=1 Tax=Xylanimonas ulmi TaxID=228973 RepID=A0A4Q7M5Z1_9MICO|nr:hypothetical protein [Xylanibacterium ulmi]RZS62008.1 hypothetical protein EV386_2325 [Xylanibacterium ulmi]